MKPQRLLCQTLCDLISAQSLTQFANNQGAVDPGLFTFMLQLLVAMNQLAVEAATISANLGVEVEIQEPWVRKCTNLRKFDFLPRPEWNGETFALTQRQADDIKEQLCSLLP